ncbi:MAG: prenyltransferase/squalene oxidase repeat-containing protein [Verrucomicrobiota bacterium]
MSGCARCRGPRAEGGGTEAEGQVKSGLGLAFGASRSTPQAARLTLPLLSLLALLPFTPVTAAEPSDQEVLKTLTTEQPRDRAVKKGLDYLRKQQKPNGSTSDRYPTALTAMSVMAFFAAGYPPADRQYGPWLRKSINYVLSKQNADGYFGEPDGSRMYGHGLATLMLAEALGMPRDDEMDEVIRKALKKAVQVTINAALVKKAPEYAGGWRYTPDATDSDLSLSGWQLLGLHATQQVGIPVPENIIAGAMDFTKKMISPDGKVGYMNPNDEHPALRGLALLALVIGHQEKIPVVKKITDRLWADPIAWRGPHFYYRAYYEAVGLSRALPEEWEKYLPKYEAVLLPHQKEDGSFDTSVDDEAQGAGPTYTTSMAVMALAVQRHVLPAYQR